MYKKGPAIIINCIFGICLAYDVLVYELSKEYGIHTGSSSFVRIMLFSITWSILCLAYNMNRFERASDRKTYWITLLVPILSWSIVLGLLIHLS